MNESFYYYYAVIAGILSNNINMMNKHSERRGSGHGHNILCSDTVSTTQA